MSRTVNVRWVLLLTFASSLSGCFLDRSGTGGPPLDAGPDAAPDSGSDAGPDAAIGPRCGDGRVDPGEECDGVALDAMTCISRGFPGGNLVCSATCTFDESLCGTPCGNGIVDSGEECDGRALAGQDCTSFGLMDGALACLDTCMFDTRACVGCGNGVLDGSEQCDEADFGGLTCTGGLACDASCEIDTTACSYPSAGDGADGDLTIDGRIDFGPANGGASYAVETISLDGVTVTGDATELSMGDEVLLINAQGDGADCGSVGRYELARVMSVFGGAVTFTAPIVNNYGVGDRNLDLTGQTVILQRVPNYGRLEVLSGRRLAPPAFNRGVGGILAFRARELIVSATGLLSVDGRGFRGGVGWPNDLRRGGRQGESMCGDPQAESVSPNFGGGGGGAHIQPITDGCGQGGGGGGHASVGVSEGFPSLCVGIGITMGAANGGESYGEADLNDHLFFGSGGGAGASDNNSRRSGTGGRGAGIMLIWAARATIDGRMFARGGNGSVSADLTDSGNGGGGSGGSLFLRVGALDGMGTFSAAGGLGFPSRGDWNASGGDGSEGRVRIDYFTVDGMRFGTPGAAARLNERSTPEVGHAEVFLD